MLEGGRARRSYFHIQTFTKFSFNCISIHFYCPPARLQRQTAPGAVVALASLHDSCWRYDFYQIWTRHFCNVQFWLTRKVLNVDCKIPCVNVKNLKSANALASHFSFSEQFRFEIRVHNSIYNSHSECSSFLSFLNLINPIFLAPTPVESFFASIPTQKMAHKRLITASSSRVET